MKKESKGASAAPTHTYSSGTGTRMEGVSGKQKNRRDILNYNRIKLGLARML